MPPKKVHGILELKKQLEKEKKKKEQKEKEKKKKPGIIVGGQAAHQIKIKTKEEQARREFFSELLKEQDSLSPDDLLSKLLEFGSDVNGQMFRNDFIKNLASKLSESLIYEYAVRYISTNESSTQTLKKFLEDPEIRRRLEIIGGYREESKTGYESEEGEIDYEEETVKNLADEFEQALMPEEIPFIHAPRSGPPLKTKLLQPETLEEIEIPIRKVSIKYGIDSDAKCIEWYRNTPWLDGRASVIWIYPADLNTSEEFYHSDNKENHEEGMSKMINNKLFFRANQNFVRAQCGFYRNRRKQIGNELIFYDKNGKENRVEIFFEVNGKMIRQTEEIFKKEKEVYIQKTVPFNKKVSSLTDRTVELLSDTEKEILKNVMIDTFESMLKYAKIPEDIIEELAQPTVDIFFLEDGSVRMLLEKFSLFLANFDITFLTYARTFRERLSKGVYTPEFLINAIPADILPEIYLDPRVDNKSRIIFNKFIIIVSAEIYTQLSYNFFFELHPQERRIYLPSRTPLAPHLNLPTGGLVGLCKNRNDLPADISPYNLYIYPSEGEYYCFDLGNLPTDLTLFGENPETGEMLPDKVFEEIRRLSAALEAEEEVIPSEEVYVKTKEDIAPGLIQTVIEDIMELENEMGITGRKLLEELDMLKETEEPQDIDREDEIVEKIENICGYCQQFVNEGQHEMFSSIIQGKNGSKLIKFCNTECFEKMSKWPKLRKKIEKLEEIDKARKEAQMKLETKLPTEEKQPEPPQKLPCFYPADCETSQYFNSTQIREIAEECGVPIKTAKGGLRVRENLCKDIKEKIVTDTKYQCKKCETEIEEGQERNLKDEVFCSKCFDIETLPHIKKMLEAQIKMEKEENKVCVQCQKVIGSGPAWRSSDWGQGIVHYCRLKCFQDYEPGTKVKKSSTEIEKKES